MNSAVFFLNYFTWHYGRAFKDLLNVWTNFFWFIIQFFSIPLLLKTLLSPFKRIQEESHRTGLEDFAETIVMNVMSRLIGAIVRLFIVGIGLVSLAVWIVALVILLAFWLVAPAVLALTFIYGLFILFV